MRLEDLGLEMLCHLLRIGKVDGHDFLFILHWSEKGCNWDAIPRTVTTLGRDTGKEDLNGKGICGEEMGIFASLLRKYRVGQKYYSHC